MSLRATQALVGTSQRLGVLCLAGAGRTCIAHGLPETPDTILFSAVGHAGTPCVHGLYLESWDATSVVFNNVQNSPAAIYLRLAVETAVIR